MSKQKKVSLRGKTDKKLQAELRRYMSVKNWNSTKCAVFLDTSKTVIESALYGTSMNVKSIDKIKAYLNDNRV